MPQNDLQTILLAILVPTAVLVVLIIVVGVGIVYLRMRRRLDSKFTHQRELPSGKDMNVYAGWFCSPMSCTPVLLHRLLRDDTDHDRFSEHGYSSTSSGGNG